MTSWVLCPRLSSRAQEKRRYTERTMGLEYEVQDKAERDGFLQPREDSRSCCCAHLPRDDGVRLFLEVYNNITRGSNKLEHEKLWWHTSILPLAINMSKYQDRLPRDCGISMLKDNKNDWQYLEQSDQTRFVLSRVEHNDLPFNLNSFGHLTPRFQHVNHPLLWLTFLRIEGSTNASPFFLKKMTQIAKTKCNKK